LAQRHDDLLAAGTRLFGASIDRPAQHAAMVEKLRLPFPLLSDPDRDGLIRPLGVADERDAREIARPAMVLVDPDGAERWRFVSRDYADRLPEDEVVAEAARLGLDRTAQAPPATVDPEPGPKAMTLEALLPYFRGARFAALAMGLRHRGLGEEIADDSKAYVAQMDRFTEAVRDLRDHG
jgi:hypothetical protein